MLLFVINGGRLRRGGGCSSIRPVLQLGPASTDGFSFLLADLPWHTAQLLKTPDPPPLTRTWSTPHSCCYVTTIISTATSQLLGMSGKGRGGSYWSKRRASSPCSESVKRTKTQKETGVSSQKQIRLCPLFVLFMLFLHKDLPSTIVTTRAEQFFPFWPTSGVEKTYTADWD